MNDPPAKVYGLEYPARALAAQPGDDDGIRFLIGTQSLVHENQLHLVQYNDEEDTLQSHHWTHAAGEIRDISSNPGYADIVATCHSKLLGNEQVFGASLWRLPPQSSDHHSEPHDGQALQPLFSLTTHLDAIKCTRWHPTIRSSLLAIGARSIFLWDVAKGCNMAQIGTKKTFDWAPPNVFTACRWSSHQNSAVIVAACGQTLRGYDTRSLCESFVINSAHGGTVRDVDVNPNKQHNIVSCGDDGLVKFWDTRSTKAPLFLLSEHTHWVWSVKYNSFHDQLVLSASSDAMVVLSNVPSLSSESPSSLLTDSISGGENFAIEDDAPALPKEGHVKTFGEHDASVYAVEWSTADPWVFASLSFDGCLVINKVPKQCKYGILLKN